MTNYLHLPARKPRTKRDQAEFLKSHFGCGINAAFYDGDTRFAHNVKITHLPLDYETEDKCLAVIEEPLVWQMVVEPIHEEFGKSHPGYEIWPEGRSSGYWTLHGYTPSRSEDYSSWSAVDVRDLFNVVWDFDHAREEAVAAFVDYATSAEPEEA